MPGPRLLVAPIWPLDFLEVPLEKRNNLENLITQKNLLYLISLYTTKESDFGFQLLTAHSRKA